MMLSRTEVVVGLVDELDAFGALVGPLDATAWEAPTRCEGWTVGDVAAHVIGSMADVSRRGRWPSARVAARLNLRSSWPR